MTETEVKALIAGFEDHTWPASKWTHLAHLVVCLHYAMHTDLETNISMMREGIKTYNVAAGKQNTDHSGYHETITVLFVYAIRAFWEKNQNADSWEELITRLEGSVLVERPFMFQFYSKDRLFSVQARREWVEPDKRLLADLKSKDFFCLPATVGMSQAH